MTTTTASMQQFGTPSGPDQVRRGGSSAGLVLLYSESRDTLAPCYPLTSAQAFIGRDPTCAIAVAERAVSRRHAVLEYRDDGCWWIRDLGGANGTIVDGTFVDEMQLEHLHEVRVGDTIFKYVIAEAELYARYGLDGTMAGGAKRKSTQLTELVGGMQIDRIGAQIERIAPIGLSVVIQGETGTGKELVARELHRLSRRKGPLRAINCAAIPATLIESELFGYVRGAFSGADRDKLGLVAAANHGTLLLDEIGDMPLDAQAKLLRVIQTREVYPLGATVAHQVDVRFVCATHRDLQRLATENRFRGDLLSRLNEFSILVPPLRERKEDLFLLSRTLLDRNGQHGRRLSFPFMLALLHHDWPFNVRELESCLKRAAALSDETTLGAKHLPDGISEGMLTYGIRKTVEPSEPSAAKPSPPRPARRAAPTEAELRHLLELHRGNVAAVGRELGKERMQIHRWMQRYGIAVDDYRS